MIRTLNYAPPNSLFVISDVKGGKAPDFIPNSPVMSSSSCILAGCLMFQDGETEVTLGPAEELRQVTPPVFDGQLETPSRAVAVSTVEWTTLMTMAVKDQLTRVRIWPNRAREPDRIAIGLG
jgi:hypothetical protein